MSEADAYDACCCCRDSQVWLLKRAQIFVGDVWGAFQVGPRPNSKINPCLTRMLNEHQVLVDIALCSID